MKVTQRRTMFRWGWLALAATFAFGSINDLTAQERETVRAGGTEGEGEEELRANAVGLFFGGTTNTDTDKSGFAFGADYERRLSRLWGIGLLAELTVGEKRPRDFVLGLPLSLHPIGGLRVILAPGLEIKPPGAEEEGESGSDEKDVEGLVRLGASYEFEVGRYTIAPEFDVDLVRLEEVVLVYGVALGLGF